MRALGVLLLAAVAHALPIPGPLSYPSFELHNSAVPGLQMPAVGLGTGGYGLDPLVGYNGYPECWITDIGCGGNTEKAVKTWLSVGGTRLDSADSYFNDKSVGKAVQESGAKREDLFILSKVGPSFPLGYNDTLEQFAKIKANLRTDYVDALLIHWPTYKPSALSPKESSDPSCNLKLAEYDAKACRLSTWRAMVKIFQDGGAKSIGVSNYNKTHIQEIIDAGLPLPAINQCPYNPYRSTSQQATIEFCKAHNITWNAYSPLGIPDWHKYPAPHKSSPLLEDAVQAAAAAHTKSPAQVVINWIVSQGFPTNPRSMNATHMKENLEAFDFALTDSEKTAIGSLPQDLCSEDGSFYECDPGTSALPRPGGH